MTDDHRINLSEENVEEQYAEWVNAFNALQFLLLALFVGVISIYQLARYIGCWEVG
jgi:hypothetical protein